MVKRKRDIKRPGAMQKQRQGQRLFVFPIYGNTKAHAREIAIVKGSSGHLPL